jgi:ABC-type amino acid transport system permease subunit
LANEVIVLLKETSIMGYVGLQDLTRGGDIIRNITYSAMLPLLAVAAIYLVIVMIMTSFVSKLERSLKKNER